MKLVVQVMKYEIRSYHLTYHILNLNSLIECNCLEQYSFGR